MCRRLRTTDRRICASGEVDHGPFMVPHVSQSFVNKFCDKKYVGFVLSCLALPGQSTV